MDKPEEVDFLHLLYGGMVAMLLLVVAVVLFVVAHQRRAYLLQTQLRQQEISYQLAMLQSVVASQENERERIAQDLHDEIGASLSAARLFVNQIGYEATDATLRDMAQQASQIIGETLQNVRSIVQNLSPIMLEKFGLYRAITLLGKSLETSGLQVELHIDPVAEQLDATTQLTLYRIVQEMLANVTRHAQAQLVMLYLQPQAGKLQLQVTDDGCGFVQEAPKTTKSIGMGLTGISARAKLLDGQLAITSSPGTGTRLTLLLPLPS